MVVFSNLDLSDFPKVAHFFPLNIGSPFTLPTKELIDALSTVGDFSGEIIDQAECTLILGDTIQIDYKSTVAKLTEYIDFGNKLPKGKYKINPFYFTIMLKNCDKFKFIKEPISLLLGQTQDRSFKCILAIDEVE